MKIEVLETINHYKYTNHQQDMRKELIGAINCKNTEKDILIVIKDQLEYLKVCIDSIFKNTTDFNLYLWDNASGDETKSYLSELSKKDNIFVFTSDKNEGFLEPNNRLAEKTKSPYLILLNSDTEVKEGWDKLLISWLTNSPQTKQVGFCGCLLNEDFKGGLASYGNQIDYLAGWCFCISRGTYNQFGLFDEENLKFAYCEDADFSLRIKEAGYEINALYSDGVVHYENKTTLEVCKDKEFTEMFKGFFESNHNYMINRWKGKEVILAEKQKLS